MTQKILILLILLSHTLGAYAGADKNYIWEGNLNASQLQAFLTGGYRQVKGNLLITDKDIQDLSALKNLTQVVGDLYIKNNQSLTSLTGLAHLTHVSGRLLLEKNQQLSNLAALKNLTHVGELNIHDNNQLANLQGLDNLKSAATVSIFGNGALLSIKALSNLKQVSLVSIRYNFKLRSLQGLGQITAMDELQVTSNLELKDFKGFNKITTLDKLYIDGNRELHRIEAFSNLQKVNEMYLSGNGGRLFSKWTLPHLSQVTSLRLINQQWLTLKPFKRLTKLTHLDMQFMPLDDLTGLEALTSVDYMVLANNDYLKNLKGLNGLKQIKGLVISKNPMLRSLQGLEHMHSFVFSKTPNSSQPLWSMQYTEGLKFYEKSRLLISKNKALANYDNLPIAFLQNLPSASVRIDGNADNPTWKHLKLAARMSKEPIAIGELQANSLTELSLLRNEVFARYGYEFSDALQPYFEKKGWYKKSANQSITLSDIEESNIKTIKTIENSRKQTVKATLAALQQRYKTKVDFLSPDDAYLQAPLIEFIQHINAKEVLRTTPLDENRGLEQSMQVICDAQCECDTQCQYNASIVYHLQTDKPQIDVHIDDYANTRSMTIRLDILANNQIIFKEIVHHDECCQ